MTRRYDTITQLRYGPEVMTPLPPAVTAPARFRKHKTHLDKGLQRLVIGAAISPTAGLPADQTIEEIRYKRQTRNGEFRLRSRRSHRLTAGLRRQQLV